MRSRTNVLEKAVLLSALDNALKLHLDKLPDKLVTLPIGGRINLDNFCYFIEEIDRQGFDTSLDVITKEYGLDPDTYLDLDIREGIAILSESSYKTAFVIFDNDIVIWQPASDDWHVWMTVSDKAADMFSRWRKETETEFEEWLIDQPRDLREHYRLSKSMYLRL